MDEEELWAGPEGVLLADGSGGGACFLVSRLELAPEVSGASVGRVGVEDVRGVHDEDRPTKKISSRQFLLILHFTFSFASKRNTARLAEGCFATWRWWLLLSL